MWYKYFVIPEKERLMQANKAAHLDFVKVRVYTMAPMKPRTAKKIPIQDIIWISTIILLVSPEKQELIVTCNTVSFRVLFLIHYHWLVKRTKYIAHANYSSVWNGTIRQLDTR